MEVLREYVIKKLVDIWFKLNKKNKIFVYYKNEHGWRSYASTVSGELTFQIKTVHPECTYPRTFQNSQVTSVYVAKKYMKNFSKNPNWTIAGVQHHAR